MPGFWIVVCGFVASFLMAMAMGANDVANAFGTSVGSGVLRLWQAIVLASVCNLLGAVSMGGAVTETIRKGIVDLKEFEDEDPRKLMLLMLTAMLGCITYVCAATFLGLPVSTTQAILGGLIGSMIAYQGKATGVHWASKDVCEYSKKTGRLSCGGVAGIVMQWIFAPLLAMLLAVVLFAFCRRVLLRAPLEVAERRAPAVMAFFLGGVAFALAWFIVVQEQHHPHSRGWDPRSDDDPVNNATALEVVSVILIGVGCAYAALTLFSLRPASLRSTVQTSDLEMTRKDFRRVDETNPMHEDEEQLSGEQYDPKVESVFGTAQICTASLAAFAAGANDVANEVAPLAAILQTYRQGEVRETARTPRWLFAYAGGGIALGLALFGKRVMRTIGRDTVKLTPSRGFNIELGYSLASLIASAEGWPVSTTQLAVGALVGVGLVSGDDISHALNFKLLARIFGAWVLTPASSAIFAMVYFAALHPAIN